MATASVQSGENECPLCHENFTTPKILPCAHLLCRPCLVTLLETEAECPLCRYAIVTPEERASKTCAEIADALPTDVAMEVVVECSEMLKKKHVCCGCKSSATSVCLNCSDMLCCSCAVIHTSMSMLRDHEVESLATLTPESLAKNRRSSCVAHPNRTAELHCPTHGSTLCYQCVISTHRTCTEVIELDEKLERESKVLADLADTLTDDESKLVAAINNLDEVLHALEKTTQSVLADIDHTYDILQRSVDSWRRRVRDLVLKANTMTKAEIHSARSCLTERRGRATSLRSLSQRLNRSMSRACALSGLATDLQGRAQDLDFSVRLPTHAKVVTMTCLKIDKIAVQRLSSAILKLGTFKVVPAPCIAQPSAWRFHTNRGKNIVLSNNQTTAERVTGDYDGVVVSADHMMSGRLYEVRIDQKDERKGFYLVCGVTSEHPTRLMLPYAVMGWKSAVVIGRDIWPHGFNSWCDNKIWHAVKDLTLNSRVGLLVDSAKCLHLYINGLDHGVVVRRIKQPCYLFFHLSKAYRKVTAFSSATTC